MQMLCTEWRSQYFWPYCGPCYTGGNMYVWMYTDKLDLKMSLPFSNMIYNCYTLLTSHHFCKLEMTYLDILCQGIHQG